MVGKHIFVRCRNEQGNAGTWTAAVTENIVDKDIIRNHIEPRCNVDETFAQDTLMALPSNNILRMYYANPSTLIVSRSFWVTDRITETQGRKGAYSVSYILTDEDVGRFCSDYSGAFDPNCFETYDDLVARISADGSNKITVAPEGNIFSHGQISSGPSLLTKCNFSKDSFIAFMSGLYDAVENRKQLAVILPKELQNAWVESGDNTAELLGHYMLSLLPDFMRINCGMISHWSCQIKDKMVSDMHLLFVHPRGDEDIAYLKREGAHIVDLDTGRFTSEIAATADDYFAFVWDHLSQPEQIEDFWAYSKSNYKKLLRGRPTSASAMECIYRIRTVTEENFKDTEKCHNTLRMAAREFAGAGTRVPMAEAFLSDAISKLHLTEKPLDDATEDSLRHLMTADVEKTQHQLQEYQLLLGAVEAGTAKPETVSALCAELQKENRDADSYFLSYLTDKATLPAEKITPQLAQLVASIFTAVCHNQNTTTNISILQIILGIIENWTARLYESSDAWQAIVSPFAEAYAAYIKAETTNEKSLHAAYALLFFLRTKADADLREKCAKVLLKEEVRIYKAGNNAILQNGSTRFSVFADAFLNFFPKMIAENMDIFSAGYELLFRIIFNPDRSAAEPAISAYADVTAQLLKEHPDVSDKILQRIATAEERMLQDKPPVWNAANTEQAILRVEKMNLDLFASYLPGEERLSTIAGNLNFANHEIYSLFEEYLMRASFNERQTIYNVLSKANMLPSLFVHILFNSDATNILAEILTLLGLSHDKKLARIFSLNLYDESEAAALRFSAWYKQELEQIFFASHSTAPFAELHALALSELRLLGSVEKFSKPLSQVALAVFVEAATKLYNLVQRSEIANFPAEIVQEIVAVQKQFLANEAIPCRNIFEFVHTADTTVLEKSTYELRELCEQNRYDTEMNAILQKRIRMHMSKIRNQSSRLACEIYGTMLAAPSDRVFPMKRLLDALDYDNLSQLDRGILLAQIIIQLHSDGATAEQEIGKLAMSYLEQIAQEDGQILLTEKFLAYWRQIKAIDYARNSQFTRTMSRVQRGHSLKMDWKMLLFCLIGLVAECLLMSGLAIFAIEVTSSLLVLIVLGVVFLAITAAAVWLMKDLLSNKRRR